MNSDQAMTGGETLCCRCLNVKVQLKSQLLEAEVPPSLLNAFPNGAYRVPLEDSELTQALGYFCTTQKMPDGWQLNKCWICSMVTHALHFESQTLLLSKQLLTFSLNLQNQEHFSSLFKILVPPLEKPLPTTTEYGKKHEILLQDMVNNFLINEKKAVEERIREYSERQYAQFNVLQGQVRADKFSLLALLNQVQEPLPPPPPQPPPPPTPPTKPVTEKITNPSPESQAELKESETVSSLLPSFPKGKTRAYLAKHRLNRKPRPQRSVSQPQEISANLDTFGIFDLEGAEFGDDTSWNSSDGGDTDVEVSTQPKDEALNNPPRGTAHRKAAEQRYAKSLPIDVPWSTYTGHSSDEDLDEMYSGDPDQIAANIQALSMSMFENVWDRPSQKLSIQGLIESHPILKAPHQ